MKLVVRTRMTLMAEVEVDVHMTEDGQQYMLPDSEIQTEGMHFSIKGLEEANVPEQYVESMKKQLAHVCGKQMLRNALKMANEMDAEFGVERETMMSVPAGGAKA